jgi:hypothetical protein
LVRRNRNPGGIRVELGVKGGHRQVLDLRIKILQSDK